MGAACSRRQVLALDSSNYHGTAMATCLITHALLQVRWEAWKGWAACNRMAAVVAMQPGSRVWDQRPPETTPLTLWGCGLCLPALPVNDGAFA